MTSTCTVWLLLMTGLLVMCCGCASGPIPYWERAYLADYVMRPDRDVLYNSFTEHVYFTREAASGGRGVGGGGCGCN